MPVQVPRRMDSDGLNKGHLWILSDQLVTIMLHI